MPVAGSEPLTPPTQRVERIYNGVVYPQMGAFESNIIDASIAQAKTNAEASYVLDLA